MRIGGAILASRPRRRVGARAETLSTRRPYVTLRRSRAGHRHLGRRPVIGTPRARSSRTRDPTRPDGPGGAGLDRSRRLFSGYAMWNYSVIPHVSVAGIGARGTGASTTARCGGALRCHPRRFQRAASRRCISTRVAGATARPRTFAIARRALATRIAFDGSCSPRIASSGGGCRPVSRCARSVMEGWVDNVVREPLTPRQRDVERERHVVSNHT